MAARNSAIRRKARARFRALRLPCHLCGRAIDYDAPYLHPGEFVADHIVPLSAGGADTLDNFAPAHRSCNRTKSDSTAPVVLRVSRTLV